MRVPRKEICDALVAGEREAHRGERAITEIDDEDGYRYLRAAATSAPEGRLARWLDRLHGPAGWEEFVDGGLWQGFSEDLRDAQERAGVPELSGERLNRFRTELGASLFMSLEEYKAWRAGLPEAEDYHVHRIARGTRWIKRSTLLANEEGVRFVPDARDVRE
jgi:hypothetical protein